MNGEILLLFVVLLLALILCTYLEGNNCVSPMIEGMTSTSTSTSTANFNSAIYVAENGAKARISIGPKGTKVLTVTSSNGTKNSYITSSGDDINTYYASNGNGGTANLTTDSNGSAIITVTDSNGTTVVFTLQKGNTNSYTYSTNSFDNYNHFTGSSHASIYYGPDGGTAKILDAGNGGNIVITRKDGTIEIYYIDNDTPNNSSTTSYIGPNGGRAKIITHSNGKTAIEITGPNGKKIVFTEDNTYNNNTSNIDNNSHYNGYNNVDVDTYYGSAGGSATTVTGPGGNTVGAYTSPFGNTYTGASNSSGIYDNSLPKGIPRNQIPAGQEDLYILKSEVVPPVCPKCPDPIVKYNSNNGGGNNGGSNNGGGDFDVSKCPACPPCARCPESPFTCAKVPNYKAFNQDYMPVPVLNDFSTFGM